MSNEAAAAGTIDLEIAGAVAEIVINNPRRHNAISLAMWQQLEAHLATAQHDANVRVLILSGAGGKAFAAGADISRFESERADPEASRHYNAASATASDRLYNFPRPTIARINGYCIGGGLALALCCDLRIADGDARFAIPAARLGLGYGLAGVKRLVDTVGPAAAMDIFFTARKLGADEALRIGLVNDVVPLERLWSTVAERADAICANAPLTVAAAKAAVRELGRDPAQQNHEAIARMVEACFGSRDFIEGRRAFMEKRPPKFTGS